MAPQNDKISGILKKLNMGQFQVLCTYQKEHPETKLINFSGSLIQVDTKTPPNFDNRGKNDPVAFN